MGDALERFFDELESLVREDVKEDNPYCGRGELNDLIEWRMQKMARKLYKLLKEDLEDL